MGNHRHSWVKKVRFKMGTQKFQQITIVRVCVQPDSQSGGFDARITAGSRIRLCASWQIVIY
jgi:hypothetical protein